MNFDYSRKLTKDVSEQAACLQGWDQQYEQLSAGQFEGVVDELHVGPAQVFAEYSNQNVMQTGQLEPHRVSIALVRAAGAPGWYCGHRLSAEHLIGVSSKKDFDLVASAGMEIMALSVDTAALREHMALLEGPDAELPAVPTLLNPSPIALATYQSLMSTVLAQDHANTYAHTHAAAQRMLVLSLFDALLDCLSSPPPTAPLPSSAVARRRIVAKSRQYMRDNAHTVITIPDLCQAVGTSRRALQYAFEEVMQISPVTYLRAMRLNQVRSELRKKAVTSLGDVAARWGFWHPSRFAADYRAMFGELPSATRAASMRT